MKNLMKDYRRHLFIVFIFIISPVSYAAVAPNPVAIVGKYTCTGYDAFYNLKAQG